ncbi:MAG: tryptophan 7-halogenase [Phycisphaerae bacterium]|nr:tryptophan 7-halogenase [Phycisphaerae bacterium]
MKSIVIVGGGTSGWMSAIALSSYFPELKITVIDPSAISPIGVGESVTGVVLQFVRHPVHQLDLSEFFRETDATIKLGIWYKDWCGPGSEYLTPIDSPDRFFDHVYPSCLEDFFAANTAEGKSIGEIQTHGRLMRLNKTDLFRQPDGSTSSRASMASCQFDALKFASWLKRTASRRQTVSHVDEIVQRVEQDPDTGFVTKVITEEGSEIGGDLFLDCTGFRRLLLEKVYSPRWVDLSRYLKVDRAIACPVEYGAGQDIPVYTTATAMPNGWMFQVPVQSRMGTGYVYSSRYVSDEQAIRECRGAGLDPGESPRIIRFDVGKLASQWEKNVCAIGLAGGFLEPLEATTIHAMHVQIMMLTELFLPFYTKQAANGLARKYNVMMDAMYEDYVDFVSFHYHTGRSDTEFWRDYQKKESVTDENHARMEKWAHAYPLREDFAPMMTSFGRAQLTSGLKIWMPMLCALGHVRKENAESWMASRKTVPLIRANRAKYRQLGDAICRTAVGQEDAIRYLCGVDAGPGEP